MISYGPYGVLHHHEDAANPSNSALTAMLDSAQKSIKMSLQDFGPIAIPLHATGAEGHSWRHLA